MNEVNLAMEALLAVLPVSLSSGINLYLTILAMGVAHRGEWVTLPPGLDVVGSWPVLVAAGVMTFVEFFADKIPYVDSVWDAAHTFIRPVGALVIALNLVPAEQGDLTAAMALLAGTTALTAHSGKASLRAWSTPARSRCRTLSSAQQRTLGVLGLLTLTAFFPVVAVLVGGVLLVGTVVGLVFFVRWASAPVFGSVWGALRGKPRPTKKRKRQPGPARRV